MQWQWQGSGSLSYLNEYSGVVTHAVVPMSLRQSVTPKLVILLYYKCQFAHVLRAQEDGRQKSLDIQISKPILRLKLGGEGPQRARLTQSICRGHEHI